MLVSSLGATSRRVITNKMDRWTVWATLISRSMEPQSSDNSCLVLLFASRNNKKKSLAEDVGSAFNPQAVVKTNFVPDFANKVGFKPTNITWVLALP